MNVEELALKLQEVADRALRNEGRIKKLETGNDVLQQLVTKVAVLEWQLSQINDGIDALSKKVEKLEAKPGKRWETIVDKLAWALIAAALGFILAQVGITA